MAGRMLFAKFGTTAGWPWWICYTVPAFVTLVLPPLAFRFNDPSCGSIYCATCRG